MASPQSPNYPSSALNAGLVLVTLAVAFLAGIVILILLVAGIYVLCHQYTYYKTPIREADVEPGYTVPEALRGVIRSTRPAEDPFRHRTPY